MSIFRIMSDLHLEFRPGWQLPVMDDEDEQVLILAGDIIPTPALLTQRSFIDDVLNRFERVYWLFGNHEFYGTNVESAESIVSSLFSDDNLVFGETFVGHPHDSLIGATLWTDFARGNPMAAALFAPPYSDSTMVYTQGRKVRVADLLKIHADHREFLHTTPAEVVVTHHVPHNNLVAERWRTNRYAPLFTCTDMDDVLHYQHSNGCSLWISGHSHTAFSADLGDGMKFVSNPMGYPNETTGFDPFLVVEI